MTINFNNNNNKTTTALVLTSILVLGFAGTTAAFADFTLQLWTTTRTSTVQKDLSNSVLDSGDVIMYHFGPGRDPTATELSNLKAVTTVPNSRKGLEFFSLAEIQEHAATVKNNGLGFISYDLEAGRSPEAEVNDPVRSFQKARAAANAQGIQLAAAPSYAISNGQYADDIAKLVHRYHLQSQVIQGSDTTCIKMKDWVFKTFHALEAANPNLVGKITYQVTLTDNPAPGKTIYQTAKDCIDRTSPTGIDGNAIWWAEHSGTMAAMSNY